jgi:DNA-directed RNA polymerase subunit L
MTTTKQIVFNTEQEANSLYNNLESNLKDLHSSGTSSYTYVIKHPTDDLWAVRVVENGKYWDIVYDLIQGYTLELVSEDWKQVLNSEFSN